MLLNLQLGQPVILAYPIFCDWKVHWLCRKQQGVCIRIFHLQSALRESHQARQWQGRNLIVLPHISGFAMEVVLTLAR